jgi:CxxC-x17-CxxC domain-containing protein
MFDAVCAKCGENCQVPFHPSMDKPVYCSNCFDKGGSSRGSSSSVDYSGQFKTLNEKLDKLIKILAPNMAITEKPVEKKAIKEVEKVEIVEIKEVKKTAKTKAPAKKAAAKKKK